MQKFSELSYANASDAWLKRVTIRAIEELSGRKQLAPIYERWRSVAGPAPDSALRQLLALSRVRLDIVSGNWPPKIAPDVPLVIVGNHPFGLADGIAACALAEELGRPFKVLINADLLKVPEARSYALPIDFSGTSAALARNLATRRDALHMLKTGTTIVVFPSGGVATAPHPMGRAVELPWKPFAAKLVKTARASVLPIFFEGQCRPLFHLVSRYSPTLRLSMIIGEFKRQIGSALKVHVGDIVSYEALQASAKDRPLIDELYDRVHMLSGQPVPSRDGLPRWLST